MEQITCNRCGVEMEPALGWWVCPTCELVSFRENTTEFGALIVGARFYNARARRGEERLLIKTGGLEWNARHEGDTCATARFGTLAPVVLLQDIPEGWWELPKHNPNRPIPEALVPWHKHDSPASPEQKAYLDELGIWYPAGIGYRAAKELLRSLKVH